MVCYKIPHRAGVGMGNTAEVKWGGLLNIIEQMTYKHRCAGTVGVKPCGVPGEEHPRMEEKPVLRLVIRACLVCSRNIEEAGMVGTE